MALVLVGWFSRTASANHAKGINGCQQQLNWALAERHIHSF